jgi:hypothetical protein
MALRSGHGNGKGQPRIEVLPVDELPVGTPGPVRPVAGRDSAGRFVAADGTSALAREGGKALHESRQYARLLGLWTPEETHAYHPYWRLACEWRDAHMRTLAATVGGGSVGPGPASIIASAALQLGASRYLADMGAQMGAPKLLSEAVKLADSSRQNLLAAHELCAKETKARPADPTAAHRAIETAFGNGGQP